MQTYPYPINARDMKLLRFPGLNPEDVQLDKQDRLLPVWRGHHTEAEYGRPRC